MENNEKKTFNLLIILNDKLVVKTVISDYYVCSNYGKTYNFYNRIEGKSDLLVCTYPTNFTIIESVN